MYVLGNHDWWTLEWMTSGQIENIWFVQGGEATIDSYPKVSPPSTFFFFATHYRFTWKERSFLFTQALIPYENFQSKALIFFCGTVTLHESHSTFISEMSESKLTNFDEVYLGHTPVPYKHPIQSGGVWLMDTGAGWSGVLSIMNLDTKEIFVSDEVPSLYPGIIGRTRK